jgi:hypothetical protein
MRAGMAVAIPAKRKWGQAIENKQVCEMAYFAPLMISTLTPSVAKPLVSLGERLPSLSPFLRLVEAQDARERNQQRIRG